DEATLQELVARMRQPAERLADLRAQLAANLTGCRRLQQLARRLGLDRLHSATDAVLDYAERRTRACLSALPAGPVHAEDVLEAPEGDLELRLTASVREGTLILDFSGSAAQREGNLNCPLAVTRSACLFAVRVLTDPELPPSAGAYRPIEVRAPLGSVLNARPGAAVAAGNVETSSRVADLVLSAFGRAQGQGTMNNLSLGNERFSYYETLGGGQGACADADGPSGVHVAMSNTLNTPVEALEREFPLRVVEYALRRGSAVWGSASWARAWPPTSRPPGTSWPCGPTRPVRRGGGPSSTVRTRSRPQRRSRRRATSSSAWSWTASRSPPCCWARAARPRLLA